MGRLAFPPHLLDGLDPSKFDKLRRSTDEKREHKLSYADVELWMGRAWKEATRLGLDRSPPREVLDIGMGAGYFLHVCQYLGHHCSGLDRGGQFPFWQGLREWFGIERIVEHTIKPCEPLPKTLGKFDLVTAFRVQFNFNTAEERLWNLDEWGFFLNDVRDHILNPKGRVALKLAKQEHKGSKGLKRSDEALIRFMVDRGAIQHKTLLTFDPLR
jgi:hypothetical protein